MAKNRTTSIVLNHSIPKEMKNALEGKPYCGREELSFAGWTLAAKWVLKHKRKVASCTDFYMKFWHDNPYNETDYDLVHYWGGSKHSFDDLMVEMKKLAEDKTAQMLDLKYAEGHCFRNEV